MQRDRYRFCRFGRWILIGSLTVPAVLVGSGQTATKSDTVTNAPAKPSAVGADAAWRELQKAIQSPPFPAEWQTNRPSEEEKAKWHKRNSELAAQSADKAKDFYTRYPDHPKAADARKSEYDLIATAVQLGNTNRLAQLEQLRSQQANDKSLSEDERVNLRLQQLQEKANAARANGVAPTLRTYEEGGWAVQKDFPNRPEPVNLLLQAKMAWPHYFEGAGWGNAIAVDFGVSSIPALWLVDKKGIVRDQRGVIDLEQKVEKLLAEKN